MRRVCLAAIALCLAAEVWEHCLPLRVACRVPRARPGGGFHRCERRGIHRLASHWAPQAAAAAFGRPALPTKACSSPDLRLVCR